MLGERAEGRALRWKLFEETLVYAALRFLVQSLRLDLAERLVVKRRTQWDGRRYVILAPAAEVLESDKPLGATILFHALIGSILERAQSPAYAHAPRYYADWKALRRARTRAGPLNERKLAQRAPRRTRPQAGVQDRCGCSRSTAGVNVQRWRGLRLR